MKKMVSIEQTNTDLMKISFCNIVEKSLILEVFCSFSKSSSRILKVNSLASLPYC